MPSHKYSRSYRLAKSMNNRRIAGLKEREIHIKKQLEGFSKEMSEYFAQDGYVPLEFVKRYDYDVYLSFALEELSHIVQETNKSKMRGQCAKAAMWLMLCDEKLKPKRKKKRKKKEKPSAP